MGNSNRYYDDELEKGRTITDVSKDLGVSQPSLRRWIKAINGLDDSNTKRLMELEAENRKFKKELKNTKDTVDILKKSVAIFVKPQK